MKTIKGKYHLEVSDLGAYNENQTMYAILRDEKRCVYKATQDIEETEVYLYLGDNEQAKIWKDQPTKDGYYWYKRKYIEIEIVKIETFSGSKRLVDFYDGGRLTLEKSSGRWYGPIKSPEEEKRWVNEDRHQKENRM